MAGRGHEHLKPHGAAHRLQALYRSSYNNGGKALLSAQLPVLGLHREICRAAGDRRARPPKQFTVSRTRQLLQEEIGVNVKTLNRTIRQLKEEGFFDLCKGKITFDRETV